MAKFARYGPAPRYGLPEAGFCASAFAILQEGSQVLLGVAQEHNRWRDEWAPNLSAYEPEELEEEFGSWRFPAAYLYEGEHPDETLRRVVEEQLGIDEYASGSMDVYTFNDPSDWFPGKLHYDLCFVYEIVASPPEEVPTWFQRLEMTEVSGLKRESFGSAMGDLAVAMGLVKE